MTVTDNRRAFIEAVEAGFPGTVFEEEKEDDVEAVACDVTPANSSI